MSCDHVLKRYVARFIVFCAGLGLAGFLGVPVWTCTEVRGASVLYGVSDEMQVNCKGNPCCCDTDI